MNATDKQLMIVAFLSGFPSHYTPAEREQAQTNVDNGWDSDSLRELVDSTGQLPVAGDLVGLELLEGAEDLYRVTQRTFRRNSGGWVRYDLTPHEPDTTTAAPEAEPIDFDLLRQYVPSGRGYNAIAGFIRVEGITTWQELAQRGTRDLQRIREFGNGSLQNVRRLLEVKRIPLLP